LQAKVVEKVKTHILCSVTFFKTCAFDETTWKNIVELGSTQLQYGACTLHAWYLRLQTHSQNM